MLYSCSIGDIQEVALKAEKKKYSQIQKYTEIICMQEIFTKTNIGFITLSPFALRKQKVK